MYVLSAELFPRLRTLASEQNHKLAVVTRMLLTAGETFKLPKPGGRLVLQSSSLEREAPQRRRLTA